MHPAKLTAKMSFVEVAWRLRNSRPVVVGPEPRLVLALRPRRDVELLILRVDYPELYEKAKGGWAEGLLALVPHASGQRVLAPDGEPWVDGQEDCDARAMEPAPFQAVRWYGDTADAIEHNVCRSPNDYWVCRCRVSVPKGFSVGLIVRASAPMTCRAKMSGE